MVKRMLAVAVLALTTSASSLLAEPPQVKPVRTMYREALVREQAVRGVLDAPDALATILVDVRAVVADYESIVRHYPASGYSDDALWNAARLEIDVFAKFRQARDKETAQRLLKRMATGYPTSKLVKQVPEQLARLDDGNPESAALPTPPAPAPTSSSTSAPVAQPVRAAQAAPTDVVTIRDIRRAVLPQAVRVTIELDGEAPFHDEHITDPDRVFLDIAGTRAAPGLVDKTLRFESDADVVRQVRIGRHPNRTTRVVLDTAGVSSYSVYPLSSPFRLVIDCIRTTAAASAPTPTLAPLAAHKLPNEWIGAYPSASPRAATAIAEALVPAPLPTPMNTAPAAAAPPPTASVPPAARNATGGMTMARQLGLGVSRIVIDPGHGGHDPGAKGRGITEAELVLDVALRLEKLLQKAGMEVVLTRRDDEFVPLQERPAIANREGADLFLSIHANASPNGGARGIETYFLNFANNPNAAQVAARENAASALSMGTLPDVVKAIALNNKVDESRDFAAHVQHAMVDRLRTANKSVKDLGVKQAPFIVLIGATMPSVLAEISFVTNPQDAKMLRGNAYRQKIAEALFNAVRKYQTSLKTVQTVAHQ